MNIINQSISDSLLLKILSYLEPKDLCKVSRVCKHFFSLSFSDVLWAPLLPRQISFQPGGAKLIFKELLLSEHDMNDYRQKRNELETAIDSLQQGDILNRMSQIGLENRHPGNWDEIIGTIFELWDKKYVDKSLVVVALTHLKPSVELALNVITLGCEEEFAILYLKHCHIPENTGIKALIEDLEAAADTHHYSDKFITEIYRCIEQKTDFYSGEMSESEAEEPMHDEMIVSNEMSDPDN